jgi:hypothetical protein
VKEIKPRTPAGKEKNSLSRLFYWNKKSKDERGKNGINIKVEKH